LTLQGFSNYSGGMDADLKALEEKLTQLIARTRTLQSENVSLREELEQAQVELKRLKGNMTLASSRIEALIGRLPQEDEVAIKEAL
jgi:cell division protein ZapB